MKPKTHIYHKKHLLLGEEILKSFSIVESVQGLELLGLGERLLNVLHSLTKPVAFLSATDVHVFNTHGAAIDLIKG
jgi:hypothetical protein